MSIYTKARTLFLLRGVFSEKYSFFSSQCVFHVYSLDTLQCGFVFFFSHFRFAFAAVLNVFLSNVRALYYPSGKMERNAFPFFYSLSAKGIYIYIHLLSFSLYSISFFVLLLFGSFGLFRLQSIF